jgi:hypothetical protein
MVVWALNVIKLERIRFTNLILDLVMNMIRSIRNSISSVAVWVEDILIM